MNEEEIAKIAKRRVEERTGFRVHLAMFALVNTGLFITWWMTGSSYPWFIWPLIGWGAGLVAHALTYWFGPTSLRGEKAIEREIQRLRASQQRG
jgi:hypothetical protein